MKHGSAQAVAVFGGTFDPVHYGHLRTAVEIRQQLQLDDFRFLPAGRPPHRTGPVTDWRHRLAMLDLALSNDPGFSIDQRELHRDGPSYMIDTLRELRTEVPLAPIMLVIGQDSASALDDWHQWREILSVAHLVIMTRPGDPGKYSSILGQALAERQVDMAEPLHGRAAGFVLNVEVTSLSISSSGIRTMLRNGKSLRFLLPDPVIDYIQQQGLYQ